MENACAIGNRLGQQAFRSELELSSDKLALKRQLLQKKTVNYDYIYFVELKVLIDASGKYAIEKEEEKKL